MSNGLHHYTMLVSDLITVLPVVVVVIV